MHPQLQQPTSRLSRLVQQAEHYYSVSDEYGLAEVAREIGDLDEFVQVGGRYSTKVRYVGQIRWYQGAVFDIARRRYH